MEFLKTVKEIPIADKKVRLDDMENIRQRLKSGEGQLLIQCQAETVGMANALSAHGIQ